MDSNQVMNLVRIALHIGGTVLTLLGWVAPEKIPIINEAILATVDPILKAVGPITNAVAMIMSLRANSPAGVLRATTVLPAAEVAQATVERPDGKAAILDAATTLPAAQVAQAVIQMPEIKGIVTTAAVATDTPSKLVVASTQELEKKLGATKSATKL